MKKIAIILSVVVACIATSCVKPYEEVNSLALDNYEVNLPKSVSDTSDPVHYCHITSNGSWTAKLETENGNSWCWMEDSYLNTKGEPVKVVTGVSTFDGMDGRYNKVKGSGSVFLPIHFTTAAANRYATLIVTNTSTGKQCILRITQK